MDGKILTLLQILSSFQDAFSSNPVGEASVEVPHAKNEKVNSQTQHSTEIVVDQVEHENAEVEKVTG
jgi:hypothetical protein